MEGRHGNSPFRSSWMRVINTHVFNRAEWRAVVSKRVSIRTVAVGTWSQWWGPLVPDDSPHKHFPFRSFHPLVSCLQKIPFLW